MPKVSELENLKAKILAYGVSQSGKTRFFGTMPGPRYLFNFEKDNIVTLRTSGVEADYDNYDDRDGYTKIISKILELKKECPYESVAIDTGNGLYRANFQHILRLNNREEKPQIQDWGLAAERTRNLVREVIGLNVHVLVTFHEQLEKDETSGDIIGRILIPGKHLPDELPAMFNMFLRFRTIAQAGKEPKRMIVTTPDSRFPAGERFGVLAPTEEPDFMKMWEKIEKKIAGLKHEASKEAKEYDGFSSATEEGVEHAKSPG